MLKYFFTILFCLPLFVIAQINISGSVTDISTNKPVENASVILSNTSIGAKTDNSGAFTLRYAKSGQYDLVISIIGYETYHKVITVTNENIVLEDVKITGKTTLLKEVVIRPDAEMERNFELFKQEFLGSSESAKACKILNPNIIDVSSDNKAEILSASSNDFIEVENDALGYKVKYLLTKFTRNYHTGILYFEGSVLFENLPGSEKQQKKWINARAKAYYGSLAHYLKSCLKNNAANNGFETRQLIQKPNPQRLPDDLIQAKLKVSRNQLPGNLKMRDSLSFWEKQEQLPKASLLLIKTPINPAELIHPTDQVGIHALVYPDMLDVVYTKIHDNSSRSLVFRQFNMPDYLTTIISIRGKYVLFDENGRDH